MLLILRILKKTCHTNKNVANHAYLELVMTPTHSNKQHISATLKARRKELKLTQADLASFAGVSLRLISGFETKSLNIQFDKLMMLATALGYRNEPFNYPNGIGQAVIGRRKLLKLNQNDVASFSGVSRSFVIDLENGKETIRAVEVFKVLHGLGMAQGITI